MAIWEFKPYLVGNSTMPTRLYKCSTAMKLTPSITIYQTINIYVTTYEDAIFIIIEFLQNEVQLFKENVKSPFGDL